MADKKVGIIGGGRFGTAIAKLLSRKTDVLIYSRRSELVSAINDYHHYQGVDYAEGVRATDSLEQVCGECTLIFPIISSVHFRNVIHQASPYLTPQHIVVHGTKGFDRLPDEDTITENEDYRIRSSHIKTMSDVILEETDVSRVGALCGPNLASEILEGLPTATVVASEYDEVIKTVRDVLTGPEIFVFGSYDVKGAELAGALKNVIALASGMLAGRHMGKNAEAMLITRGLSEIIKIAQAMGVHYSAFLGTAGIGDLIATATTDKSRNFSVGKRIAQGEELDDIIASMNEVAEGVRSIRIAYHVIKKFKIPAPIISTIYEILYKGRDIDTSIRMLMKYPYSEDVDFL